MTPSGVEITRLTITVAPTHHEDCLNDGHYKNVCLLRPLMGDQEVLEREHLSSPSACVSSQGNVGNGLHDLKALTTTLVPVCG